MVACQGGGSQMDDSEDGDDGPRREAATAWAY